MVDALGGRVRPRRARALSAPQAALVPVKIEQVDVGRSLTAAAGYVEIILASGTIRAHGRIDAESLRTVLDCLAVRA
jgi:hypothetical protein